MTLSWHCYRISNLYFTGTTHNLSLFLGHLDIFSLSGSILRLSSGLLFDLEVTFRLLSNLTLLGLLSDLTLLGLLCDPTLLELLSNMTILRLLSDLTLLELLSDLTLLGLLSDLTLLGLLSDLTLLGLLCEPEVISELLINLVFAIFFIVLLSIGTILSMVLP